MASRIGFKAAGRLLLMALVAAFALGLLGLDSGGAQNAAPAEPAGEQQVTQPADYGQVLSLLQAQKAELGQELRRLHRELAAVKQQLEEPGLGTVFSGIGYILGLFGTAFFIHARAAYQRRSRED